MASKAIPTTLNYRGNTNLKRGGVRIEWTKERVEEYIKCRDDPVYFIENYMKIINTDRGLISFKLYDYQKEMIRSMQNNRFTIIGTARQAGKSTTTCGFILWFIIFHSEKVVALLANKADTAREILGRVQLAYQHLPRWIQVGVLEWNKGSFVLENNSRVIAAATSSDSIRGYSINLLFIDEAAHIERWEQFFTSTFPTVTSGETTKVVLVSTPFGLNHFWNIWKLAEEGKNGYNPIKVTWHQVPGRDVKWRDQVLAGMNFDMDRFRQEYEVQFLGSSGTLISGWKLEIMRADIPLFSKDNLTKYENPVKNHKYVISCDVSRGKGLDYSAFNVIDVTEIPYRQVCTFRDNLVTPIDYAEIIFRTAKAYNNAQALVELNDIGGQVADSLFYDFEYEDIVYTQNAGRAGKRISLDSKADRGLRTTKTVKALGCSILKLLIEQDKLIIKDAETIFELSTFSKKNNSFEAEEGRHDDLVMTLVIFSWMTDQGFFKELTDIDTMHALREKTEEMISEEMIPFGFIDDGREERDINDITVVESWLFGDNYEKNDDFF